MLTKRLNPYVAILALTVIGAVGTLFVLHEISETDFASAAAYGTSSEFSIDPIDQ